ARSWSTSSCPCRVRRRPAPSLGWRRAWSYETEWPSGGQYPCPVRRGRGVCRPCNTSETRRSSGRAVDTLPAPVDDQVDHRRSIGDECLAQRRLEGRIVLDADAPSAQRARGGGEVDRAEVRRHGCARTAVLVAPDHAVALVVEGQHDRSKAVAHGRL